jgi:hypothetical protein
MTGRWVVGVNHVFAYQDMIAEAGFPPFPTPVWATAFGTLHLITFVIGTLATVYFMSLFSKNSSKE